MKYCPLCQRDYAIGGLCPLDGATLIERAVQDPLIGLILKNSYRIESRLAEGAMSIVYVARQLTLDRLVVVKFLRSGTGDADFVQLFLREARIASQLNHPNVLHIIDFGNTEDGRVFLVAEYLRGESLEEHVQRQGALRLEQLVWLMEQIGEGLSAAHRMAIVHRDLKPANIVLARLAGDTVTAKLLDFGISKPLAEADLKYTRLGMVMGTPGYLAPEQIEGRRDIDPRADIYALGAILFFLCAGRTPYQGGDPQAIMAAQLSGPPDSLASLPLADARCRVFEPLVREAMARSPEARIADVAGFLRRLHELAREGVTAGIQAAVQATAILPAGGSPLGVNQYRVVFAGELKPGESPEAVCARLGQALRLDEAQVGKLFSGSRVVLKKQVGRDMADRFVALLDKAGAVAHRELVGLSEPVAPSPPAGEPVLSLAIALKDLPAAASLPTAASQPSVPHVFHEQGLSEPTAALAKASLPAYSQPMPGTQPAAQEAIPTAIPVTPRPVPEPLAKAKRRRWPVYVLVLLALIALSLALPASRYRLYDLQAQLSGWQAPRGVEAERVRLGMLAPFSGAARELGRGMQLGVTARFLEQNELGGVHGRRLELNAVDDGYEPARSLAQLDSLLVADSGVFALIGDVGTPTTAAVLPRLLDGKTLLFGTFSGAELLRHNPPDRYVFNYRASYAEETAALVRYFVEEKKLDPAQIAVFHQNDAFGLDGLKGVEQALAAYGVAPEAVRKYSYARNSVQVDGAVQGLLAPGSTPVAAIVQISTYAASAAFTVRLRQGGYRGEIANVSFVGSDALSEAFGEAGPEYGEGVLVSQVVPLYSGYASGVLRYREAMKRWYPNEEPDFVSLEGYIVASLFIDALQRAGRHFDTESLVDVLEQTRDLDLGVGTTISFHPSNHQGSHRVWGTRLRGDGRFESVKLKAGETL
ncbi:MAG: ABC transporter substrate-binding protein [Gammaproteobacteria bacterium]|nr:ABC transporter substrate-binding protein [Gammaproteobacteria bacterium]